MGYFGRSIWLSMGMRAFCGLMSVCGPGLTLLAIEAVNSQASECRMTEGIRMYRHRKMEAA